VGLLHNKREQLLQFLSMGLLIKHCLKTAEIEQHDDNNDNRTRGHSLKLQKHHCHLDLRKFFFSERVITGWNALDNEAVTATSINNFKNHLQCIREKKKSFYTDT